MLQRVNFIMMLVVLVMVAIVGWQVLRTQSKTAAVLQGISSDLTRMKYEASTTPPAGNTGVVYLDGDVARPGQYKVPDVGVLTLDRMITAAGGIKDGADAEISVDGEDDQGKQVHRFTIRRWSPREASNVQYSVKAGDRVTIKALPPASTSPATADADAARVLVEGDLPNSGWHAIDMDHGTTMAEFLRRLGVTDTHWVTYRRNGTAGEGVLRLGRDYLDAAAEAVIMRPNDELRVQNEVDITSRRNYFRWKLRSGDVRQDNWISQPQADGRRWVMVFDAEPRSAGAALIQESGDLAWRLDLRPEGAAVVPPSMGNRLDSKLIDWDMRIDNGHLVLDFTTIRDDPRRGSVSAEASTAMPKIAGGIEFAPAAGDDPAPDQVFKEASRAWSLYSIALDLFAGANPEAPPLREDVEESMRSNLSRMDTNHRYQPETAKYIRDTVSPLLAKFVSDPRSGDSNDAEARLAAFNDFVTQMLVDGAPKGSDASPAAVLDRASSFVNDAFKRTSDPNLATRVRLAIGRAKQQALGAKPSEALMTETELQKFIPRLMNASVPNAAGSSLPTLEELNRGAATIEIVYAADPTLAKLRGMADTVRARLDADATGSPTTRPGE